MDTDEAPTMLVCTRLADMTMMHPDQVEKPCCKCGRVVGVYPTGQRILERWPGTEVMCVVCSGYEIKPDDDIRPAGSPQEILQEARDSKQSGRA